MRKNLKQNFQTSNRLENQFVIHKLKMASKKVRADVANAVIDEIMIKLLMMINMT